MAFIPENLPRFDTVSFGAASGSEPVVNYVARLDGISQYWQLSEDIIINDIDDFEFKITVNPNIINIEWMPVISGESTSLNLTKSGTNPGNLRMITDGRGLWGPSWVADVTKVISIRRVNGVLSLLYDEVSGSETITVTTPISINNLGRRIQSQFTFAGLMSYFKVTVNGILINEIPLTNKAQGATQLPSVGNVSATMVNYTPDVWEEV